jgi:hypothetical protein
LAGEGAYIVKFIKYIRIRWYGRVERIRNHIVPKQIAKATMEGTR